MTRSLIRLGKRLSLVALAGLGAVLALVVYGELARADISLGSNLGEYTYRSSDCNEPDADAADPVNVIFYDDATQSNLDYYFNLYHGWGDNDGETQYFKTWYNCYEMDGQPSSGQMGVTRYHARYQRGLDPWGNVDVDNPWGDYSVASAHYEEWIPYLPGFNSCDSGWFPKGDHAVPNDGFNQGRDNVVQNWVTEGGHHYAGTRNWDNRELRDQCNDWVAASNGDVAFIRVRREMPAPSSITSSFVYLGSYNYKNRLTWSAVSGAYYYKVCWDTSVSGSFSSCNTVYGTQSDQNMPSGDGTKWYNKVKSCSNSGFCGPLSTDYTLSQQALKDGWNYQFTFYRSGSYTVFQYINWMSYLGVPLGLKLHIKDGSSIGSITRTTTSCLASGYISNPASYTTATYFTSHKLGTRGHTIGTYNQCGSSSDHSGDAAFNRWGYVPPYPNPN
jgi:hypothetical protein